MSAMDQSTRAKLHRVFFISLNTIGWMIFGISLGFGTMWTAALFAYGNPVSSYDSWIIITVFCVVVGVLALLLRFQQRRQNTTVGDYWRLLISLVLCIGVGAFTFLMIDGLISLIPYY